jgi:general nucleoside transport system permease protein
MDNVAVIALVTWFAMAIRMAIPVLFTALGGLIAQKSGVFNFGVEAMMLVGAFLGYYGSLVTGSPWIGLLFAVISGALLGLFLGFASIRLGVNQLVIGIGTSIFALGLTSYLYRLMNVGTSTEAPIFPNINIPGLSDIPILGTILFQHSFLVYIGFIIVPILAWFFKKTTIGLNLRAAGENPQVVDTAGIDVYRYRYIAMMISGMLAALGGSFLTLTQVSRFLENITSGRGWIAISAIILGKYNPWGVLAACLLFGAADALQMQAQVLGVKIPYPFLMMTPYVLAILAISGVVGKVHQPAAQGQPYMKD